MSADRDKIVAVTGPHKFCGQIGKHLAGIKRLPVSL
jgi:hypothetical protein